MGSTWQTNLGNANPYGLTLLSSTITAADGTDVPHEAMTPDMFENFRYSVALLPLEPLDPLQSYRVQVALSWDMGNRSYDWAFTTGADPVPAEQLLRVRGDGPDALPLDPSDPGFLAPRPVIP